MRASRVSKRTYVTFLTRKDRRIHDEKYLHDRPRFRRTKTSRRAKSVKHEGDYA